GRWRLPAGATTAGRMAIFGRPMRHAPQPRFGGQRDALTALRGGGSVGRSAFFRSPCAVCTEAAFRRPTRGVDRPTGGDGSVGGRRFFRPPFAVCTEAAFRRPTRCVDRPTR